MATRLIRLNLVAPPPAPAGVSADVSKAAGIGSTIVTSFRIFPFLPARARWIAGITEFEWNHHFADVQETGPFRSWHHRHRFARETRDGIEGTLVSDVVDYEVGFGFLGEIANALFIRNQMRKTFASRQKVLESLLARAK